MTAQSTVPAAGMTMRSMFRRSFPTMTPPAIEKEITTIDTHGRSRPFCTGADGSEGVMPQ
jgi:hypothetical protein